MEKKTYKDNIKPVSLINKYCIYHQENIGSKLGLIRSSVKIRDDEGKEEFKCKLKDTMLKWKISGAFYAINPMIQPIPSGALLLCSKTANEFPYNTESLKIVYDPFNLEDDCVYFIAWTKRIPYAIPLYIYGEDGNNIYPSFKKLDDMSEIKKLSPIFVLGDPYTQNISNNNLFIKNNKVNFTFKSYQGRCIPDPEGVSLSKCMVLNNKNITDLEHGGSPPTILEHVSQLTKKENRYEIFERFPIYLIGIILFIFVIALVTCIFLMYTKNNDKTYKKGTRYGRK
jgi:hypothetical protein